MDPISVILFAENASQRMGGEAAKNIIYFKKLRERGIEVWLVCHTRVKDELLRELSPGEFENIFFINDTPFQVFLWKVGQNFPTRIQEFILWRLSSLITQLNGRRVVRQIIKQKNIQLLFQATPNTPKAPSFMYGLGVPVIMGPIKGGMDFPPAFHSMDSPLIRIWLTASKLAADFLHQLIPGRLLADALIIADEKTRQLLPRGYRGRIYEMIECGVDLKMWKRDTLSEFQKKPMIRYVFTGRLVDWKGVGFLLEAFKAVTRELDAELEIVGDGPLRKQLETQAKNLGIRDYVNFRGWIRREDILNTLMKSDVFVMPSLRESGGNSVLEAMALKLPVIAVNWGGPARTMDSSCGILINPDKSTAFIKEFSHAMITLGNSPELRKKMGEAGLNRLKSHGLDWDSKVDRIISIFSETLHPLTAR